MGRGKIKKYPTTKISVPKFCESNGFYTTPMRSNAMAKIKSTGTKPEMKLKKCLWDMGIRYKKCSFKLPGNPDLSFVKYKLVVFVDGSFWHGHDWGSKRNQIRSNREFWISKIERNRQRDQEINHFYLRNGWRVLRFWDFEIKKELGMCVKKILDVLTQDPKSPY